MSRVFITGDRTGCLAYPALVAGQLLQAVAAGEQVVTGDNDGVEALVRGIAALGGVPVEVIETPRDASGTADWDRRHRLVILDGEGPARVVAIHVDPFTSKVVASALQQWGDGLQLVTEADLLPS